MAHEATAVASIKPHNVESQNVDSLIPQQLQGVAANLIGLLKEYYNYMNIDGIPTQLSIIDSDADATELGYDDLTKSDQHLGLKVSGFVPTAYNQIYTRLTPAQVRDSGFGATIIYQGVEREEYYIMKLDRARSTAAGSWVMVTRINDTIDIDFYDKNWETYPNGSNTDNLYQIEFIGNPGGGGYDDPVNGFSTGGDLTPFQIGLADPIGLLSVDAPEETKIITFTDIPTKGGHGTGLTVDITVDTGKLVSVEVNQPGSGYEIDDDLELDLFYNSGLLSVQETMAGPSNVVRTILEQHDIDKTTDDYLVRIQKEIAKGIPEAVSLDKNTLYKKIVEYYNTRGSKISVQSFFRIFFDEAVRVVYPKDVLLKPSSGQYTGTSTFSNTKEKYFYKKGNDEDLDARIEFLQDSNYNNERVGTYFIDFEFGDDFKKGVNAPAVYPTMTGNEAAVFPYTMLFSGRNNRTSTNFNSKDFYQGAGVFLQIDANNDLIIKGRFGEDNGQISDFTHTISNYISGTGDLPFQEPANDDKKRLRMALSIDARQIPAYQRTASSGDIVVSGAVASNYNGTYTFNATTNRFVKGDYYFMKEADDHWSFNYSTTFKVRASTVEQWPYSNVSTQWAGTIVANQTWAFNTSGFTEGDTIYKLGRVRLTTTNFGTTNNSPADSDNGTNNDIALAGQALSNTQYVNLYPGALGRVYLENSMGGFGHDRYKERPDENPDGEIYFFNFAFYNRFVTDAEAKAYVNNNITPPNDQTHKLIDIELNNGGSVNFTNKGQSKIIAKNVTGFKTGYTSGGGAVQKNAPFKETNYGLSSTGSGYPRNISWKSVKGFLSDVNVLHDGNYYQEFSYLIKTSLSSQNWKDAFNKLVHPSGLRFFNALLLELFLDNPVGKKINAVYAEDAEDVPVGGITSIDGQDTIKVFRNDYRAQWISEGIHRWFEPFKPLVGRHSPKWQYGWFEYLAERLIEIVVYKFAAAWYQQQQFNINNLGNIFYDHEHGLRLRQEKSDFTTLQGNAELTNIDSSQELSYDKKYIELDGNATAIKTGGEIDKDSVVELTFKCLQDGKDGKGKYIAGTKWTGTDGFERELSIKQIENAVDTKQVEVTVTDNGANEITSGTLDDNNIHSIEVTAETFDRRSGEFGVRFNDSSIDFSSSNLLGENELNGIFTHRLDTVNTANNTRPNMRGHHLFQFDRTTKVIERIYTNGGTTAIGNPINFAHFDTYGTLENATTLATRINAIANGKVVILVSYDASGCNGDLRKALVGCGAEDEKTTWKNARVGHAFIGVKGTTSGAVERIETNLGGADNRPNDDGNPIVRVTAQYTTNTFKEGAFYSINRQPKFKALPVKVPLYKDGFTKIRVKGNGEVDRIDPLIGSSSTTTFRSSDETDSKFYTELVYGNEDYRHRLTHTQPTLRVGNKFLEARLQYNHVTQTTFRSAGEENRGFKFTVENFTLNPKYKAYAFIQFFDANNNYVVASETVQEITGNGDYDVRSDYAFDAVRALGFIDPIGFLGIKIEGVNATPDQIPDLGSFDVKDIQSVRKSLGPQNILRDVTSNLRYVRESLLQSNASSNDFVGYLNFFEESAGEKGTFISGQDWGRADLEIEEVEFDGTLGNNTDAYVSKFRFKPNSSAAATAITNYANSPATQSVIDDYNFWTRLGKKFSGGLGYSPHGILPEDEKDSGGIFTTGLNRDINLGNKTPIDKNAEYEISVTLKNLIQQEDANNRIYIGVQSLDENGLHIQTDLENSYNYGVVQNKLLSSNETLTFTGKFKGFNPRTIIPEGEETLTEDIDPLKFVFGFGFGGWSSDLVTDTYVWDSSRDNFAFFGGGAILTNLGGSGTNDGRYGETPDVYDLLTDNPISFANPGKIEFTGALAPGNSTPTTVYFKFERDVHPNTDPSFETERVVITGSTERKYTINIPAGVASLTYKHLVMFIEETDQAIIVKDATVFDDRLGGQGTILKTNDNRFDPGAKFFNVVILTNHHTNREREEVYTSLYNGPNGPKGAIGPHVPSTMIKEIRIKRTDGKAIRDDKVDRQHQMFGVKKIHDSALPFLDTEDATKNNIKSNTLAIGTVNENKSFIGVHTYNDSPATSTNLLQTTSGFEYPWKIGAGFKNISGFNAFGTVQKPYNIEQVIEVGTTTKLVVDGIQAHKAGDFIRINYSTGLTELNATHKVLEIPSPQNDLAENELIIDLDISGVINNYKKYTGVIAQKVYATGLGEFDFDRSEVNTVYGKTPWGNNDVVARTQNLDDAPDIPKLNDAGEIVSRADERQDGGFITNIISLNNMTRQQMGSGTIYASPHISDDYRYSVYFKFDKVDGGNWYFGLNVFNGRTQEIGVGSPRVTAFGGVRRNIVRVDRIADADATDEQSAGIYVYTAGHNNYNTGSLRHIITLQGSTTFNGGTEYYVGEVKKVTIDGLGDVTRIKVFKNSTLTSELTTTDVPNAWDLKGTIQTVAARNPYFSSAAVKDSIFKENTWYLAVGILFGKGGVDQELGKPNYKRRKYIDLETQGGIYEVESGKKIRNATARQLIGEAEKIRMRNFLWRVPEGSATTMDIFEPRIEILNGTETPFEELFTKRVESTYPSNIQVQEAFIGGSESGEKDCKYLLTETKQTGNSLSQLTSISKRYDNNAEIWNTPATFTGAIEELTLENTLGKAGTTGLVLKGASIADTREFTANPYTPDFTDSVFGNHSFTNVNGGRAKFRNSSTSDGEFRLLLGRQFTVRSDQWSSAMNSPSGPAGTGEKAEFHLRFYAANNGTQICASVNPVKPGLGFRKGEVIKIDDKAFRDNTPSGANLNGLYFVIDDVGRGVVKTNGALANFYQRENATYNGQDNPIEFTRDKAFSNNVLHTPTVDYINDDYHWEYDREYEIEFTADKLYDKNKPANLYIGGGNKVGYYKNLGGLGLNNATGNPNSFIKLKNHGDGPFEYSFVSSTEGFCRIYIAMMDCEGGISVAHNGHVLKPVNTDARGEQRIDMRKAPFDYKGGSTKLFVQPDQNQNTNQDGKIDREDEMVEFVLESEYLHLGENFIQIFNNRTDGVAGGYIKVEPASNGLVTTGLNTHTICMRSNSVQVPKIILSHTIDSDAHRYTDGENSSRVINNSLVKLNEREGTLYEYNWQLRNIVVREKSKRVYHGDFRCIVEDPPIKYSDFNKPFQQTTEDDGFGIPSYRPVDTTSLLATDGAIGVGGKVSVPALDEYDTPSDVGQIYMKDQERVDANGVSLRVPQLGVPKGKYGVLKFEVQSNFTTHYVSIGENLPEGTLKSNTGYQMTGKVFIPTTNSKLDQVYVMAGVNPYRLNEDGVIVTNPATGLPLYRHPVTNTQIFNSPQELRGFDSYSTTPTNITTKGSWVSFTHNFKVPELFEDEDLPVVRFVTKLKKATSIIRDRFADGSDVNGYGPDAAIGEKFYLKDIVIKEGIYSEAAKDKESIPSKFHTTINYKDDVSLELDFNSPTLSDAALVGFDLKHKNTDNFYELRQNNNSSVGNFSLADLPTYESNKLASYLPFKEQAITSNSPTTAGSGLLHWKALGNTTVDNSLIFHETPFGRRVVWKAVNDDGAGGTTPDGGAITVATGSIINTTAPTQAATVYKNLVPTVKGNPNVNDGNMQVWHRIFGITGSTGSGSYSYDSGTDTLSLTATRTTGTGSFGTYFRIRGLKEGVYYRVSGQMRVSANTTGGTAKALVDFSDNNDPGEFRTETTSGTYVSFSEEGIFDVNKNGKNKNSNYGFIDINGTTSSSTTGGSITVDYKNLKIEELTPDGGFITAEIAVDKSKDYRFSVWVKKTNTDFNQDSPQAAVLNEGGIVRIGVLGRNSGVAGESNAAVAFNNVSAPSTPETARPLFVSDFDLGKHDTLDSPAAGYTKGLNNDKWFLVVAHLRRFDADVNVTTGSPNLSDSGIYVPSKPAYKIRELETTSPADTAYNDSPHYGDWKMTSALKGVQFVCSVEGNGRNSQDPVYFFAPRIDEVNGLEPTIEELTSGAIIEKANIEDFDKKLAITTWNNPIADTELSISDYRHAIEGDDFTVNINNTKFKNITPVPEEVREISYGDAVHSRFKTVNGLEITQFIITTSDANDLIVLPFVDTSAMNIRIDWGDGSGDSIYSHEDAALAHTYETAGNYVIKISGDWKKINCEATEADVADNYTGDPGTDDNAEDHTALRSEITTGIANFKSDLQHVIFGKVNVTQMNFKGCTALASFSISSLTNTAGITTLAAAFENCAALKSLDLRGMDTSNVTDFSDFMKQSSAVTGVVVKGLHSLNISSATTLADMFDNVTFNSDELGRTYLAWANNTFGTTPSTLTFDAGNTQYPTGSTADSPNDSPATDLIVDARTTLDTTKSWTITDGGVIS